MCKSLVDNLEEALFQLNTPWLIITVAARAILWHPTLLARPLANYEKLLSQRNLLLCGLA